MSTEVPSGRQGLRARALLLAGVASGWLAACEVREVEDVVRGRGDGGAADAAVAVDARGGAPATTARLVWPAPGTSGVPPNLDRVLIEPGGGGAGDGGGGACAGGGAAGAGVAGDAVLFGPDGPIVTRAVEVPGRCGAAPTCVALLLSHALPAQAVINLGSQSFTTAAGVDTARPSLGALRLHVADGCVVAELGSDEPVLAEAHLVGSSGLPTYAQPGARRLLLGLPLPAGATSRALTVEVAARDLAGNEARLAAVLDPTPALPRLALTEVLANPAGAEPTQEWVELANLGGSALELEGFVLATAASVDVLPAATLPPGARALVVPAGCREGVGPDPPPDARARLLRIADTALGKSGLGNAGEALELRAPDGRVVSTFGAWLDTSAAAWNGRSVERVQITGCDVPLNVAGNRDNRSTPGGENSVEP